MQTCSLFIGGQPCCKRLRHNVQVRILSLAPYLFKHQKCWRGLNEGCQTHTLRVEHGQTISVGSVKHRDGSERRSFFKQVFSGFYPLANQMQQLIKASIYTYTLVEKCRQCLPPQPVTSKQNLNRLITCLGYKGKCRYRLNRRYLKLTNTSY